MRHIIIMAALAASTPALAGGEDAALARGKHLVEIAGCNDCHTAGYAPSGGQVPESEWLKGSAEGWNGPWGTTYPINLRLFMQTLGEDDWVSFARTKQSRPPMPSFAFQKFTEQELRDLYKYVRSLGAAGDQAPAYLPPGVQPPKPYITLVLPDTPPAKASE